MENSLKHYEFGKFRLESGNRLLICGDERVHLTPKMFDLLLFLVENHGRVVSHDQIFDHVWEDVFVTDSVLVQNIATLRRALKSNGNKQSFIETIPKRGYQFVGEIRIGEDQPRRESRRSIAVLPFQLQDNDDLKYSFLSVSVADALNSCLGRFPEITVRPTSSVLLVHGKQSSLTETGKMLGVDYLLSSRLLQHEELFSALFKLHLIKTGEVIWQRKFDFTPDNILVLEKKIAARINQLIAPSHTRSSKVSLKSPTRNPKAYQCYLKGRYFWSKRSSSALLKAVSNFQESVNIDKGFSLAYTGLCDSYTMLINYGVLNPLEAIPPARLAAARAIQLDPELSEARASKGYIFAAFDWNWQACEKEFLEAIELNPNNTSVRHWLASLYIITGQNDKSLQAIEEAREIDPLSLILSSMLGWNLYLMGQFEKAEAELKRILELKSTYPPACLYLGRVYSVQGRFPEAIREFQIADEFFQNSLTKAEIAQAFVSGGKKEKGLKILDDLLSLRKKEYVSPYSLAFIYQALANREMVFELLEETYWEDSISMQWFGVEPRFADIRKTKRGIDLLRRTNHLPIIG